MTHIDTALAEALRRIGPDRSHRRIRALGGAVTLMAACGAINPQRAALHLRVWLRRNP